MAEGDDTEKNEAPTGRRLAKARADGQVPVSRELVNFAGLLGASAAMIVLLPYEADRLGQAMVPLLANVHGLSLDGPAVADAVLAALRASVVIGVVASLLTVAVGLGQTNFLFSAKGLKPNFGKLNPLAGAKRMVGPDNLVEFLKSCVKLAALSGLTWWLLAGDLGLLLGAIHWTPGQLAVGLADELDKLLYAVLGLLGAIVVLDVFWTRHRHIERLKMSRQDIKEEAKESDGNPEVKAKLKQIRAQRSRRRMMAEVPKATVVITNPTHFAVALAYDRGRDAAPRVVAKGADLVALRIRDLAEKHRVPIVRNPPLARALFQVELDQGIPESQFQAVAEVIAFVWRLSGQRGAQGSAQPGAPSGAQPGAPSRAQPGAGPRP